MSGHSKWANIKHKKGKAAKQSIPPVNRASLKDIKMGLTGKIAKNY